MPATYPAPALRLLDCCAQFRAGQLPLDVLKAEVWEAANQIALPEERGLRDLLQRSEARLDTAEFTVDADQLASAAYDIVDEIEQALRAYVED